MTPHPLFSKPSWQHFLHIERMYALPLPALVAADQFFDWVKETGTVQPGPSDYVICAQSVSGMPQDWLALIGMALTLLIPSETAHILAAAALISGQPPISNPVAAEPRQRPASQPWDPCARDFDALRHKKRRLSVYPWDLPEPWQVALRRAAKGLPSHASAAPSKDILKRLRQKLCQFAWFADQMGFPRALASTVVEAHLEDMEARLSARPRGIRWATLRATVEDLHRFARYLGSVSADDIRYLRMRLSRYETFEKGQDALKFQALLETGNTTLGVLEKADALLEQANHEEGRAARHRLRNAGAILGLFAIAPLRNANAELVFGKTLLWEAGTWVIDTEITKTRNHNPERLIIPLEPEFARYVDARVLGDISPRYLPERRAQAVQEGWFFITHPNGSRPHPAYIPRIFKDHTGTSLTTSRTMLHTDQSISRGEVGTRDTMVAAHQTSPRTAKKYQSKSVRQVAIQRVQDAATVRRAAALSPDLVSAVSALRLSLKESRQ